MRIWVAWVVVALMAGCTEAPEATDSTTTPAPTTSAPTTGTQETTAPTTEPQNGTDPQQNGTSPPPGNNPPTANVTADVTTGTAPLAVSFTLNGTDADGDALTWNLTVDGTEVANGTELPATYDHVFAEGNHSIVFTVSDGQANTSASADVQAIAPPPAGPPCETVATTGGAISPTSHIIVGVQGAAYIVTGTDVATGVYMDDNGIAGLQTEESCPSNPDSRTGP